MKLIEYNYEEKYNLKYNISKKYIIFYINNKEYFNLKLLYSKQIKDKLKILNLFISNNFNYKHIYFILKFQTDFNKIFNEHFKKEILFLDLLLIKELDKNDKLPSNIIKINNVYVKVHKDFFLKKYKFNELGIISHDFILKKDIIKKIMNLNNIFNISIYINDFTFINLEYIDYLKSTYNDILFNLNNIKII